jgi:hypothetical protein
MDFIQDQCAVEPRVLDLNYALRVCIKGKKSRACVFLYSAMKMHKEGVAAALKVCVCVSLCSPPPPHTHTPPTHTTDHLSNYHSPPHPTPRQVDVELAKEVASQVDAPDPVKKELWLDIAKYIIEDQKNVPGCVLHACMCRNGPLGMCGCVGGGGCWGVGLL